MMTCPQAAGRNVASATRREAEKERRWFAINRILANDGTLNRRARARVRSGNLRFRSDGLRRAGAAGPGRRGGTAGRLTLVSVRRLARGRPGDLRAEH